MRRTCAYHRRTWLAMSLAAKRAPDRPDHAPHRAATASTLSRNAAACRQRAGLNPGLPGLPELQVLGRDALDWGIVAVFGVVYLGMFLGGLPRLKLDRSGVALLGAIAAIAFTGQTVEQAARAVDLPTIVLLFAFMVVSAQMRLGGFYTAVTRSVGTLPLPRAGLLAVLIAVAGALAAVFSNDIVCLAMTPVVARLCLQRGLQPLPFLIGLACAANIGSAATLIGNPQNMLIGSMMKLHFADYLRLALPPVAASLLLLWLWLAWGPGARAGAAVPAVDAPTPIEDEPPFDAVQTAKGLSVATLLLLVFLFTGWPRDVAALVGAGVLLLSRRLHSAQVMGYVDWQLLLLFIGLFVVNDAFASTGLAADAVRWLGTQGVHLADPGPLLVVGAALSNLVSNVPAVMLLLPHLQGDSAGAMLALVSTFAGNLLLVGSIANLIVVDLARRSGIDIDWKQHARTGVPVTLATLLLVWGWLSWAG
jgi:Na+/H+ antiporter NhaD/arsenite permease-like protein